MRSRLLNWASALALAVSVASVPTLATAQAEPDVRVNSLSGAYLAARVAENDNDLDSAIRYYQRALAFDPDSNELRQNLMVALIANGRFDEALPIADQLKEVPEVERFSRVALAIDEFRKQDYDQAQFFLKLVMETDLDRLITGLMTAWAKVGGGDMAGALAHVDSMDGPAWFDLFVDYHKALIAETAGNDEAVLAGYEALVANPGNIASAPEAFLRAAESYAGYQARKGRKTEALGVIDTVEQLYSGRLQLTVLREKIEAGEPIEPLIETPLEGASEVLLNLGSALNRGGGESFVRLYLRMALALRPDSDSALLQLASVMEKMRQPEAAIALYEAVPADSPAKDAAELQLGLNLADLERTEEAIGHLVAYVDARPEDMRGYSALGSVYAADKKFKEAADVYERAVARIDEPTAADWNIFYQRGIAYERLKQWDKAEPNFFKALELYPDHPQVLNYLGYSWVDMNMRLEEGLELIRKAVDARPSDGYIVDSLGWAYYRLGRYEDAVAELERAVSLMPGDPVLNDHLGDAYWRVGRRLEAGFQWSHARDLEPEPDVLAQVLRKLEDGLPPAEKLVAALDDGGRANDDKVISDASGDSPDGIAGETGQDEPASQREVAVLADPDPVIPVEETFTVAPGDSLWAIARERLGAGARYTDILRLNPGLASNPDLIMPGQELRLPGASE